MTTDYNLTAFKAISSFTKELAEMFDDKHHPLKLYLRLLEKTTLSHEKAIQKHIDAFRKFCVDNGDELSSKNKVLKSSKVEYSSRVYIDFDVIFKLADRDTEKAIWRHLLTISAIVYPSGKAKEILKNEAKSKEVDFLSSIIDKVEDQINPNTKNPMEAVSQILSSGIFTDLISGMGSGMQDGSLDLGKMMGTVQKLCSTMNPGGAEGGGADTMNMINSLVGNMLKPQGGGDSEGANDIANMVKNMMQPMAQKNVVTSENNSAPTIILEEQHQPVMMQKVSIMIMTPDDAIPEEPVVATASTIEEIE